VAAAQRIRQSREDLGGNVGRGVHERVLADMAQYAAMIPDRGGPEKLVRKAGLVYF
jgi:hypothetical protein